MWRSWNPCAVPVGLQNVQPLWKTAWGVGNDGLGEGAAWVVGPDGPALLEQDAATFSNSRLVSPAT